MKSRGARAINKGEYAEKSKSELPTFSTLYERLNTAEKGGTPHNSEHKRHNPINRFDVSSTFDYCLLRVEGVVKGQTFSSRCKLVHETAHLFAVFKLVLLKVISLRAVCLVVNGELVGYVDAELGTDIFVWWSVMLLT